MASGSLRDNFINENLPPQADWPLLDFSRMDIEYPEYLNAAAELIDKMALGPAGEKTAILYPGGSWTYRELLRVSNRIANYLKDGLGLIPGNRVLLRGPNTPMLAACWLAVLKAGGTCVTTMPLLRSRELGFMIDKAKVQFALCDARFMEEMTEAGKDRPSLKKIVAFNSDAKDSLEALSEKLSSDFINVETRADEPALLAFTSGTTGNPKATVHFHRDILVICDCFPRSVLKPNKDDIFCGTPPFAFTFGLGALLLFPMRVGASTLLLEKASPEELLAAIAQYKATICFTAPTGYRAMVEHAPKYDLKSLKKCVSAGETLPKATFDAWEKAVGIKIIDGIGATEMLHIFISAGGDDIRPGATGKVLPQYEARIADKNGETVARNTIGLLAVRGPTGCRYFDDPERQRGYVKNGWNYTGDAYLEDDQGYFWFQARADDMIISGGYNISGPEVENSLLRHSAVKECGVIGEPDELRGQVVKAFVVLKEGSSPSESLTKELQDFVKSDIAPYKYPRAIEFVPSLPRTETGKLQRFRLRGK